jgi:hypothetical protein
MSTLRSTLLALALFWAGGTALAQESVEPDTRAVEAPAAEAPAPEAAAAPTAEAAIAPTTRKMTDRRVITTPDSDYFGFDLRAEQNKTLEQCKSTCVSDDACRAFTYNTKAKWCFLKTDFRTINPFPGAVAGKVVAASGDPEIGAPPALTYVPDWMAEEARQFRAEVREPRDEDQTAGLSVTRAPR